MPFQSRRIESFDTIRALAILVVFLGHIFLPFNNNKIYQSAILAFSPSVTMSLMGFLSGFLLTEKYKGHYNTGFYIRRFSRIYVSLFICLSVIGIFYIHLGKIVFTVQTLLHYLGLTGFIKLFGGSNHSSIGLGLWFITAIMIMYLVLPLLSPVLTHKNRLFHLIGLIALYTLLQNLVGWGYTATWNVVTSFTVGAYIGLNKEVSCFEERKIALPLVSAVLLLAVCCLSDAEVIPWRIQSLLYSFYPLAFFPLLVRFSHLLPRPIRSSLTFFAGISFEFYILHFYFINSSSKNAFSELFPSIHPLIFQIIISFSITFVLAIIIAKVSSMLCDEIVKLYNFYHSPLGAESKG